MNDKKSNIVGIIFIVWFVASLVGMLCLSEVKNSVGWLVTLIGQYFLVFGIIGVYGNKDAKHFPSIILMFPIVGLTTLSYGICLLINNKELINLIISLIPFLAILAFPLMAILMLHMSLSEYLYLKKKCTLEISAQCIEMSFIYSKNKNGKRRKLYMPIYSIFYNNKEIHVWNNKYINKKLEEGEYYNIMINPECPTEFVDKNSKTINIGMCIISAILIIVPILILILLIYNNQLPIIN